jgi:hypothetical protein
MCGGEVTPSSGLPTTRPIWPGCPELIYQRYLAEKEAWLTEHHSVRPLATEKLEVSSHIVLGLVLNTHGSFQASD